MTTHSSAAILHKVVLRHLFVPPLHLSSIVLLKTIVHCKVLTNVEKCLLLVSSKWIVVEYTLLCVVLSQHSEVIVPNLCKRNNDNVMYIL